MAGKTAASPLFQEFDFEPIIHFEASFCLKLIHGLTDVDLAFHGLILFVIDRIKSHKIAGDIPGFEHVKQPVQLIFDVFVGMIGGKYDVSQKIGIPRCQEFRERHRVVKRGWKDESVIHLVDGFAFAKDFVCNLCDAFGGLGFVFYGDEIVQNDMGFLITNLPDEDIAAGVSIGFDKDVENAAGCTQGIMRFGELEAASVLLFHIFEAFADAPIAGGTVDASNDRQKRKKSECQKKSRE